MRHSQLLTAIIAAAVGLGSKAFLKLCDVEVVGLSRFLELLEKRQGKGLLTVSNHISVVDEPMTWGTLPATHYLLGKPMRWTLGASDICFTNPVFSAFCRHGRVLETVRGGGIKQAALDRSVELLNKGEWIHIFPEGKITQPPHSNLSRLKWGVGRLLMESRELPIVVPVWLTGFHEVMDERRYFPRFVPRPGKRISITFGDAEDSQRLEMGISELLEKRRSLGEDELRSSVTAVIQKGMERLGGHVSGEVKIGLRKAKE